MSSDKCTPPPLESRIATLEKGQQHHVAGYTLFALGVAATAAGIAAYELDSKASYGLVIAGAGAGTALGGLVVLTF